MNTLILVTGGTGTIGRRVVPLLTAAGRDVRVLTRHPRPPAGAEPDATEPVAPRGTSAGVVESGGMPADIWRAVERDAAEIAAGVRSGSGGNGGGAVAHVGGDTVSGRGLAAGMAGADVVLHLAGGAKGDDVAARNVVAAARDAGVSHLVLISVVAADRMPIGYFRAKAAAERTFAESGLPWTVLRVAQLHDFVLPVVRMLTRLPLLPVPGGLRFEPVDRDEVAARLSELTLAAPAGRVPDLAGPAVLDIRQLAAAYADAIRPDSDSRRVRATRPALSLRLPGAVGRAYRAGDNLAPPTADRGNRTWADFLADTAHPAAPGTIGARAR